LAEICLKLAEREVQEGSLSDAVSALMEDITIEKSQYVNTYIQMWTATDNIIFVECYFNIM
jgi:hypothetical protein